MTCPGCNVEHKPYDSPERLNHLMHSVEQVTEHIMECVEEMRKKHKANYTEKEVARMAAALAISEMHKGVGPIIDKVGVDKYRYMAPIIQEETLGYIDTLLERGGGVH